MKKGLIAMSAIVLVLAVAGAILSSFWARDAVTTSGTKPWPGGGGSLSTVADRYPPLQANDASRKLTALASALPKNTAIDDFVAREIARDELTIAEPPTLPDVSAMRDLLLRAPIVWQRREGIGGDTPSTATRALQMNVARALVASALANARANDATAWQDLHAVWNLARSLAPYPQMMTQTAALSMVRTINAIAWKMPLPAPAWLSELQACDSVRPLLDSFQYQTASYWKDQSQLFPTRFLAASVEHDRAIAAELSRLTTCDVNAPENELGVDLRFVWRRAFRSRAEFEATANALRFREGKPIESGSRCSDGRWTFDGATLRFSHEIAVVPPDTAMPLRLHVTALANGARR